MTVTAFLPCRAGSQRIPNKNTKPFGGEADGLLGVKLKQLLAVAAIDRVVLSTNDPDVLAIGEKWLSASAGKLAIDRRPDHLCSSATSTDEVIAYVPTIISQGDVLWTHVTSPFFDEACYADAISEYHAARGADYDSLLGVTELHAFLWREDGPINYDRKIEKWPRTQTLQPVYEVNSAVFIAPIDAYRNNADRIGDKPKLYPVAKTKALDIDWPEDFEIANFIWLNNATKC